MENIWSNQGAGGCSCKLPPHLLQQLLSNLSHQTTPEVTIGLNAPDDCTVYKLNDATLLLQSNDFFLPVVPDAYLFGKIAAANALSDIYAMGGKPILATSILAFPVEKFQIPTIQKILQGAQDTCEQAGISISGGHTIVTQDLIFGLNVSGLCNSSHLKTKQGFHAGDAIFLTKPLGLGLMTSALKKNLVQLEQISETLHYLTCLNSLGAELGKLNYVTTLTDVTGFGFVGHLNEMLLNTNLKAIVLFNDLPILKECELLLNQNVISDATYRNYNAYYKFCNIAPTIDPNKSFKLLYDPQTNGGLMFGVDKNHINDMTSFLISHGLEAFSKPIGIIEPNAHEIRIEVV